MTEAAICENDLLRREDLGSNKALSFNSDSCGDSCLGYSEVEDDEPPLDQKHLNLVHEELEKLNIATDVINKLEVQLDGARASFREIHASWSEKMKEMSKKYSSAIAKARPFYEARIRMQKLREESQSAAVRFERATSLLAVAKQQVSLTQESLNRLSTVHPECLEVLNHHIQRVNEAEAERMRAEESHRSIADTMMSLCEQIRQMEKEQRSSIKKSRTYYEQRLEFTRVLERQKDLILRLESEVRQKKCDYTTSLRNLERISDSIHEQRSLGGQSMLSKGSSTGRMNMSDVPSANPPPYLPTAPPPYDEDGRYVIEQERDESVDPAVLCMLSKESNGEWQTKASRPRSLGSGVILLAQQLIGGGTAERIEAPPGTILPRATSQSDVSYRTLPDGMPSASSPSDSSDVSSLASVRTSGIGITDDESITGMLRSHSTLMQEIECATDRLGNILRRSVSDAERSSESGVGL